MKLLSLSRIAAALSIVALLAGCALRSPSIAELKSNPGRFHDRTVSVEGVITSAWSIPMVPFKLYKVDDGTGEVTVVTQHDRVPTKGARVRVKGKVEDVATIGGRALGLHIRARDIDVKRR